MKAFLSLIGIVCSFLASPALSENWAQWRGPNQNGSTTESNLPDSLDSQKNLVWKTPMPGEGSGTPIVWEDRVFVSALDRASQRLLAICVDAKSGAIVWQREVGDGALENRRNNFAGPSAVTDGKTVWFCFGTGDLAAFDFEGTLLWSRNIQVDHGKFNVFWIYSSSPLLHGGKLYVQVIHRDVPAMRRRRGQQQDNASPTPEPSAPADSYLLIIDSATGKDLFKQLRRSDAENESKEAYTTPITYEADGKTQIILLGGDCLTGHDAADAKELWRVDGYNPQKHGAWRVVPPPVIVENKLIFCTPQNQSRTIAVRLGGSGDIAQQTAWENGNAKSDVPAPLVYQGNAYIMDGDWKKGVTCLDPATGEAKWTTPLTSRSPLRTSPTGADGKIYVMNEQGEVWVLSAEDGKILSTTTLESEGLARGSIVAANGRVYVRTGSMLYCFGKID